MKRVLLLYRDSTRLPPYEAAIRAAGIDAALVLAGQHTSLEGCEGLLLIGGTDVDSARYEEARHPEADPPDVELDGAEWAAITEALDRDLPILGICRGLQILNVHHGGTLIQHLEPPERHRTVRNGDRGLPVHSVAIMQGTMLADIAGGATAWDVNSRHHQAVKTLGRGLRVSAVHLEDGIVEAIERPDKRFVLAVQWHPEDQALRDSAQMNLFHRFHAELGR
jgi:putative glutamine amidotransferase